MNEVISNVFIPVLFGRKIIMFYFCRWIMGCHAVDSTYARHSNVKQFISILWQTKRDILIGVLKYRNLYWLMSEVYKYWIHKETDWQLEV